MVLFLLNYLLLVGSCWQPQGPVLCKEVKMVCLREVSNNKACPTQWWGTLNHLFSAHNSESCTAYVLLLLIQRWQHSKHLNQPHQYHVLCREASIWDHTCQPPPSPTTSQLLQNFFMEWQEHLMTSSNKSKMILFSSKYIFCLAVLWYHSIKLFL